MVLTEFDEEAFAKTMREEGKAEGIEEGRVQEIVLSGIEDHLPKEKILQRMTERVGVSEQQALEYYEVYSRKS